MRNVDVAGFDEVTHLPEEEREQQGANVAAVDVSVAQRNHFVIASFLDVEIFAHASADCRDQRLNLIVFQHFVDSGALDIEDFSSDRQNRLSSRVSSVNCRTASRVALNDENF